eukprot:468710_1
MAEPTVILALIMSATAFVTNFFQIIVVLYSKMVLRNSEYFATSADDCTVFSAILGTFAGGVAFITLVMFRGELISTVPKTDLCTYNGSVLSACFLSSGLFILSLAAIRFAAIVRQSTFLKCRRHTLYLLFGLAAFSVGYCVQLSFSSVVMRPSGVYCFPNITQSTILSTANGIFLLVLSISILLAVSAAYVNAYIYFKARVPATYAGQIALNLLFRVVTILIITYFLTFVPVVGVLAFEIIMDCYMKTPAWLDLLFFVALMCIFISGPVLSYIFSTDYREVIARIFCCGAPSPVKDFEQSPAGQAQITDVESAKASTVNDHLKSSSLQSASLMFKNIQKLPWQEPNFTDAIVPNAGGAPAVSNQKKAPKRLSLALTHNSEYSTDQFESGSSSPAIHRQPTYSHRSHPSISLHRMQNPESTNFSPTSQSINHRQASMSSTDSYYPEPVKIDFQKYRQAPQKTLLTLKPKDMDHSMKMDLARDRKSPQAFKEFRQLKSPIQLVQRMSTSENSASRSHGRASISSIQLRSFSNPPVSMAPPEPPVRVKSDSVWNSYQNQAGENA